MILILLLVVVQGCQDYRKSELTVTCIDVGQGDAVLLSFPNGKDWLVDAGGTPAGDTDAGIDPGHRNVLPVLRAKAIQSLDVVVMTHPDEDHTQGMLAVARHVPVGCVYWNGFQGSLTEQRVRKQFQKLGTRVELLTAGNMTHVGGVDVHVLSPPLKPILGTRSPENENSIVLLLTYLTKSILLTGDVEAVGEQRLLSTSRHELRNLSLLKVAHHGSDSSSTNEFVQWTHPQTALISCGKRNRYGHPSSEVLKRFERIGTKVFRTDDCGMIEWTTDGTSETVSTMLPCNENAPRNAQGGLH
ncbi:MAG: ComEC/Rec2 family competence protein [Armatimonadota bacterium]